MQPTVPRITTTVPCCCRDNNAEPVCTILMPCELLVQMVLRSPFLLGLSHQTLTARMQALRVALPTADVQCMAQYSPSLLEVMNLYDSSSIMCCICFLSSMRTDAAVHAANNGWLSCGQCFTFECQERHLWGMGVAASMLACGDGAGE